jgi:hypothetical protein
MLALYFLLTDQKVNEPEETRVKEQWLVVA